MFTAYKGQISLKGVQHSMAYSLFCFVFRLRSQNTSCYLVCVQPTNEKLVRSQDELNHSRIALLQLLFKFTWKATKKEKKKKKERKKILISFVNT